MRIKNYTTFVNEEIDDFYDDLEKSNKKIKLLTKFSKIDANTVDTKFTFSEPKKKFQPKVSTFNKKKNNDKGIF
jgi:hypothetical protein